MSQFFFFPRAPPSYTRRRRTFTPTSPPLVLPSPAPKGRSSTSILLHSISSPEWTKVPLLLVFLWAHASETLDGSCRNLGDVL